MSDLVVEYHELEDSQAALEKIMKEFDGTTKRVEGLSDIWGNDDVAGAMHGFATDWKDHREKLLKKMEGVAKDSEKCLKSWESADRQLAQSLETHHTTSTPARPGHAGMN